MSEKVDLDELRRQHREEMLPLGYSVVPMPINAKGEGPADPDDTVRTLYEVWDACEMSVVSCEYESDALWVRELAKRLQDADTRLAALASAGPLFSPASPSPWSR